MINNYSMNKVSSIETNKMRNQEMNYLTTQKERQASYQNKTRDCKVFIQKICQNLFKSNSNQTVLSYISLQTRLKVNIVIMFYYSSHFTTSILLFYTRLIGLFLGSESGALSYFFQKETDPYLKVISLVKSLV